MHDNHLPQMFELLIHRFDELYTWATMEMLQYNGNLRYDMSSQCACVTSIARLVRVNI